jgi:transketolase
MLTDRKLFLEAGRPDIWYKYKTCPDDVVWGISEFGESGTADDLFKKFGFTVENIARLLQS